jgi:hypothetical protein
MTLSVASMIWRRWLMVEWYRQGKTEVLREKPVPAPLCPPQISIQPAFEWPRPVVEGPSNRMPFRYVTNCDFCVGKVDKRLSFIMHVFWIVRASNSFFLDPCTSSYVWVWISSFAFLNLTEVCLTLAEVLTCICLRSRLFRMTLKI